jgi:hypothetical protein
MSNMHLQRYIHEVGFRWNHRIPFEIKKKIGEKKVKMEPLPVITMLNSLIQSATGKQQRRKPNGGLRFIFESKIS